MSDKEDLSVVVARTEVRDIDKEIKLTNCRDSMSMSGVKVRSAK